jgi:hypothetical protein
MHRSRFTMAAVAALLMACNDPSPAPSSIASMHQTHSASASSAPVSKAAREQIQQLRELTKPYRDFDAAVAAGWGTQITECFQDATLGGMGYHYGNTAYIDGAVDALKPELLLYEPGKKGRLELVAVEYIVPFGAWTASQPPSLYGQSFHRNEAFGIWVLHVWHERHNPSGVFMDWNPKVNCDNAGS